MKIKTIIEMKTKCENRLRGLDTALNISGHRYMDAVYDDKITLTITQAEDVKELLQEYNNLLTEIINKAEVEI